MEDLRELSITSLLNDQTVLKLYLDAVEHKDERITEACSNVIIERFEDICSRETAELSALIELNLENFIKILNSDNLMLLHEDVLIDLVRSYINEREKIEPKKKETAEAQTPAALWALLSDTEKENRNLQFEAEMKEKND